MNGSGDPGLVGVRQEDQGITIHKEGRQCIANNSRDNGNSLKGR